MRRILSALTILFAAAPLWADDRSPVWEVVQTEPATVIEQQQPVVDVVVRDGEVLITTDTKTKVEVFTILGQIVTAKTVTPGTTKLLIRQRGIYILKIAGTTRRINI